MIHSCDLRPGGWEGERPADAEAGEVFQQLFERYISSEGDGEPPTPAIRAFVAALKERWYEIADPEDVDDTSPWSNGPLINNASGPIIYFATRPSMADEVSAECPPRIAADLGLQ